MFCEDEFVCEVNSIEEGRKITDPITDPEFRASAKGTISYYGLELDMVRDSLSIIGILLFMKIESP